MIYANCMALSKVRLYLLRFFIAILLFVITGALSTYFYWSLQETGGVFFPGLLYTTTTILIFLLTGKKFPIGNFLKYYFSMVLTYLVVWFVTMASSWVVMFCGPVTAGLGAVATFVLTDMFITKINYKNSHIFIIGALAFVMTEILYFIFSGTYDMAPIEYIFKVDIEPVMLFQELFLFWQVMVGMKLFLTVAKASR